MKIKIIYILLVTLLLSIDTANAKNKKNVCEISWTAKVNGITIGKNEDRLLINSNESFEISSLFTPNSALKLFGLQPIKRKVLFSKDGKIQTRQEDKTIWKRIKNNTYQKIKDSEPSEDVDVDVNIKTIDSTVFPYLAFLNLLNKNESLPIVVFGKNSIYPAKIKRKNISEKDTLFFEGDKNSGQVDLDSEGIPEHFSFSQDGHKVEGYRTSWTCSN